MSRAGRRPSSRASLVLALALLAMGGEARLYAHLLLGGAALLHSLDVAEEVIRRVARIRAYLRGRDREG